jgi:UDP-N-acetylglucosamine 1-carboxyvinyltransferase
VKADDLRSGAGLLIAGAMADGETRITEEHFILRGYENVVEQMNKLSIEASWCERT